jgi:hypothetical protein
MTSAEPIKGIRVMDREGRFWRLYTMALGHPNRVCAMLTASRPVGGKIPGFIVRDCAAVYGWMLADSLFIEIAL